MLEPAGRQGAPRGPRLLQARLGTRRDMEWHLDDPTGTLQVTFNRAEAPSRDEVGAFLEQVKSIASQSAVRALLVNGERVTGHRALTYPEIATPVLYEAARWRTLGPQTLT